jgi:hypothetical protein
MHAQDPVLPPSNLGLANYADGITPGAGIYYANFSQIFQSSSFRDADGDKIPTNLKINSYTTIHQFVYLSKIKILHGELGFTAFLPVVRITASNRDAVVPTVNSGVLGDAIVAPAIVWFDKKLFGKPLFHRLELDFFLPTGSYSRQYAINSGSNLYTLSLHHSFTYFLTKSLSISMRNHIDYNSKIRNTEIRPGMAFHTNYSLEYNVYKNLTAEVAGYYLKQISQDSYDGNHQYFQDNYGISDTKEQVFAVGPGLGYLANSKLVLEGKVFFEMAARNREQGVRPTVRLAYKF